MKRICFFLLLFTLASFSIKASFAAETLRLVPAHTDLKDPQTFTNLLIEGNPGETKEVEIAAVNLSTEKIDLELTSASARVDGTGNLSAISDGGATSVAPWIVVPAKNIAILPKERKVIPLTIKIPSTATSGEHIGTISALNTVLPVWIKVKGETQADFTVLEFSQTISDSIPNFNIKVRNKGNTAIPSLGFRITLTNAYAIFSGRTFSSFWGETTLLLPGEEKTFSFSWNSPLPFFGNYQADLEASAKNITRESRLRFSLINSKSLLPFLLQLFTISILFLILLLGFLFLSKKLKNLFKRNRKPSGVSNDMVRQVVHEEGKLSLTNEDDYEKLLFKVRRIVREEIVLWKEMDNFRKAVKKEIKEELIQKNAENKKVD